MQNSTLDVDDQPKRLRRDAARNRELILEAAAAVFAESGVAAGYDVIARRAGVGVGTVYRRFPERADLIEALFEAQVNEVVAAAETAQRHPDSWLGLCQFLEQALDMQAVDRGLSQVLFGSAQHDHGATLGRDRIVPAMTVLLDRAKRDRQLRSDVAPSDIGALMLMISSVNTPGRPDLWRRYLALFLDALAARPEGSAPLPLAPPGDADIIDLMRGF